MAYNRDFYWECFRARESAKVNTSASIYPSAYVQDSLIGPGCAICPNARLVRSSLGRYSYVQHGSIVSNAIIGKYCSIAPHVAIGPGEHPVDCISTHPVIWSMAEGKEVTEDWSRGTVIGNDVWIEQNAIVRSGVKIGDGAVVAAGAVVVKDVGPYEVVGGVPARQIRMRFSDDIVQRFIEMRWWDYSHEAIVSTLGKFAAEGVTAEMLEFIKEKLLSLEKEVE
jgi:acetyltransferase-like isoleucine patch superfamily enzyme